MRVAVALVVVGTLTSARLAFADEPTKKQCVSANESAQDQRRNGKLRSAKGSLAICMATTCPGPVRQDCAARFAEIEAVIPSLVFVVRDASGRDVHQVRVTMDGAAIEEAAEGVPLEVDPGERDFTFEAEGLRRTERHVVVREGDRDRRIEVIMPVRGVQEVAVAPSPKQEKDFFSGVGELGPGRKIALGLGVAGAAALVVGSVFGLTAKITYDHAVTECPLGNNSCTAAGVKDGQSAKDQAAVSTVAFIGGAVLIAGGVALFLTANGAATTVAIGPQAGSRAAGVLATGTW
ncbi:MAG: hypothetical protein ABTD50_05735 [Polyangiaceae bacterium]|jgi:hypothetical protein